jgi:outer membrane protein insertion porin family
MIQIADPKLRVLMQQVLQILVLIIAATAVQAQQADRKIARIEVQGLQRLAADEVVAATQLKPGTPFSVTEVDAAGQRLIDSGLFTKVGYQTRTDGSQVTIIFQVEETKSSQSPVLFDNFVWFTDEELYIAIKREVPSFNGTAPDVGTMTDSIKLALQNLLNEKEIKGSVEYAAWQTGVNSAKQEHLFSVTGLPIPICKLNFPGARNLSEETLIKSSRQLIEADYSHKSAVAFGGFILYPLYREAGQWRAKFEDPKAKLEDSESCKGGVSLTIPVDEGPVYLWDKAEWTGNEALSPSALDDALGMRTGEVLKGSKFDKGLIAIRQAYGRIGHLEAAAKPVPAFDDAGARVSFKFEVNEGSRYTMGNLSIKGLDEASAQYVQDAWKLRRSEVFNASYINHFVLVEGRDALRRIAIRWQEIGKSPPRVEQSIKTNLQSLTADVTLEFRE